MWRSRISFVTYSIYLFSTLAYDPIFIYLLLPTMNRFNTFMMFFILNLFVTMGMSYPNSAPEHFNCGSPTVAPMTVGYSKMLVQVIQKLAQESEQSWAYRETQIFNYGDNYYSWNAIVMRVKGVLTGYVDEGYACVPATIYYRGGCRESQTCKSEYDCSDCINSLANFLLEKCSHSKVGNGFAFDCFVRYQNTPFVPPRLFFEWPTRPWPLVVHIPP